MELHRSAAVTGRKGRTSPEMRGTTMSLEILEAKGQLKELVDTFSNLADEKRIADQMSLFTPDTKVQVFMGDDLLFDIDGTAQLEETFNAFTANVKRSNHM
ncbi:MAG: hypothetical protein J0I87_17360, partial [Cellulomonas sp.]|nr:hypothetical protein [Cellulomonas sp.]